MDPQFLYRIYLVLFDSDVPLGTKKLTLEAAATCRDSWRVTHVSKDAIDHIRAHRSTRGLHRAHALDRQLRAKYIFERGTPLSEGELFTYFWKHDSVTLVTKAENGRGGTDHWSALTEVPPNCFTSGSFSLRLRKLDLAWVESVSQREA